MREADLDIRVAELDKEIDRLSEIGFAAVGKSRSETESRAIRQAMDERWRKIQERAALLREQEAPLLAELKKRGIIVDTIGQLANTAKSYDELLPLLIDHFHRDYHEQTKMAIMIVISHSAARQYWPTLRVEFEKAGVEERDYDDALANAFVNTATFDDIDEIIDMIDNSRNPSRIILLLVLKKYRRKSAKAEAAIQRLATHPEFAKEISSWPKPKSLKGGVRH